LETFGRNQIQNQDNKNQGYKDKTIKETRKIEEKTHRDKD
jgi:hypothetical protein